MKGNKNPRKQRFIFIFFIVASSYNMIEDNENTIHKNCFHIMDSDAIDIQISYTKENTNY